MNVALKRFALCGFFTMIMMALLISASPAWAAESSDEAHLGCALVNSDEIGVDSVEPLTVIMENDSGIIPSSEIEPKLDSSMATDAINSEMLLDGESIQGVASAPESESLASVMNMPAKSLEANFDPQNGAIAVDDENGMATTSVDTKAPDYSVIQDGVYYIASAKSPTRVLDVNGESKTSGANVLLWNDNGQKNQQWRVTLDKATGNYSIVSVHSNMALSFSSATNGANVYQDMLNPSVSFLWSIANTVSGYAIAPAQNPGLALDIQGGGGNNGDNIELWTTNDKPWQRYWFVPVEPTIEASATLKEGAYTIARADSPKQMIDVDGASQDDCANVLLYHENAGLNQTWYLIPDNDNFYTITSINSGKSLDIYGAGRMPTSNVIQYTTHGNANQKWSLRDNGDGSFSIISKLNGLALSSSGSSDCSNIFMFADNGSASERFVLTATQLINDGIYSIASRDNLAAVIDVPDLSKKDQTQLALWSYNKGLNQKYQVTNCGDDVYTLQVAHSGSFLEDAKSMLVQTNKHDSLTQYWKASWQGSGIVLTNQGSGQALAVSGSATNGSKLVTKAPSGSSSQRFAFIKRNLIEGGLYTMQPSAGVRVLDVHGASKSDGANIQLWDANDGDNQKFEFEIVSDGLYRITNLHSGLVVEATGTSEGSNVQQGKNKQTSNQLWRATIAPGGGVMLVGHQSGLAMSVAGNLDSNGANVQLATKSSSNGQSWLLTPTRPHDYVLDRAQSVANNSWSSTDYLITVDLTNHRTIVFQRSNGSWKDVMNVTVSTGAPETPTVTGSFTIAERGYSFGSGYTCYYWTQFYGDYLFHSVLYEQGTRQILDGRLGYSISQGCVRMNIDDAYWIYNNIPRGTKVEIYW